MRLQVHRRSLLMLLTAGAVASCGLPQTRKSLRSSEKIVPLKQTAISENPKADQVIDGGAINVRVLGGAAVKDQIASGSISKNLESLNATAAVTMAAGTPGASGSKTADNQLYIQIPISALGSKYFFGGVITTVSDRKNSDLGRLKLTDLPAFSVHTILALSNGKKLLGLMGCTGKCSATSKEQPLIGLPIIGISRDKKAVVVDVSKFGESLDMMGVLDPQGKNTGLKTIATRTTAVDMSDGTIVWDVEHKMIAKDKKPEDKSAETLIGVRYYLKLDSGMSASFVTRKPVAGVGFFTTKLREETLITRFAQSELDTKPIHYFVKNVPAEYQDAFAASFENWNKTFSEETGKEMISYEFVPAGDPKNDLLVPGDVRFNIVEWDLVNTAPYGGLGPSIASQETGETFAANVLVQGPTIEKMYNEWFKVASQAQNLAADGKAEAADLVIRDARRKIAAGMADSKLQTVASLSLGSALKFHVQSQDEHLDDPIALRQDFFDTPAGQTYDEYMNGYFKDMITHELGHNMGLRHNFKGNLYASADNEHPSQSIMEYLNREFREKDTVGEYDRMAIRYGYTGELPKRTDMFCTDEDVVGPDKPTLSAECSKDDATDDPFSYFGKILDRGLDRLVAPTSNSAPTWLAADLVDQLKIGLTGRIAYATSAESTSKDWIDFKKEGRPDEPAAIKEFVIKTVKDELCSPVLRNAAELKSDQTSRDATVKNIAALDALVDDLASKFGIGAVLKCSP